MLSNSSKVIIKGKAIRGTPGSAGLDLFSQHDYTIMPGNFAAVRTGVYTLFPKDIYGKIEMRSGLAFKYQAFILGGVIDSDYRGELIALIMNGGKKQLDIKKDDRVAQLILGKVETNIQIICDDCGSTVKNERTGGFGSTGK